MNICGSSLACHYHLVSLDMRKLLSKSPRPQMEVGFKGSWVSCVFKAKQNDIYSAFTLSLSFPFSCVFQGTFQGCPVMTLYVPYGKKRPRKQIFLHEDAIWRCRKRPSSRRFCSISLKKVSKSFCYLLWLKVAFFIKVAQ